MVGQAPRLVLLLAALSGVYALAGWLLLLPAIRLPAGIDFEPAVPGCSTTAASALGDNQILFVPLPALPPYLMRAVLAQEDRAFFRHHGVNWMILFRAFRKNFAAGEYRYGAGTITMQLMRELELGKQRTLLRKTREIAYALQAENRLSKYRILELYLNLVHWGPAIRGVGAAACYYFGIPAGELSPRQIGELVTVLTSPPRLGPALRRRGVGSVQPATEETVSCETAAAPAGGWPR